MSPGAPFAPCAPCGPVSPFEPRISTIVTREACWRVCNVAPPLCRMQRTRYTLPDTTFRGSEILAELSPCASLRLYIKPRVPIISVNPDPVSTSIKQSADVRLFPPDDSVPTSTKNINLPVFPAVSPPLESVQLPSEIVTVSNTTVLGVPLNTLPPKLS